MRLGELRKQLQAMADLPDDTIVQSEVEDDSGEFVDQDVEQLRKWEHEGRQYVVVTSRVQP